MQYLLYWFWAPRTFLLLGLCGSLASFEFFMFGDEDPGLSGIFLSAAFGLVGWVASMFYKDWIYLPQRFGVWFWRNMVQPYYTLSWALHYWEIYMAVFVVACSIIIFALSRAIKWYEQRRVLAYTVKYPG